jgi:hypothetical protein
MSKFFVVMCEGDEMDFVMPHQEPQKVIRADPVAAVRRIRQPVSQEQNPHLATCGCG